MERTRALNAVTAVGAKVQHDSGGRLVVVNVPEKAEKNLKEQLKGARLVPVDSEMEVDSEKLDDNESLFLEALKIRNSKSYREAKKKQKPGETPEEKKLFSSGSCVQEEY